MTSNHSTSPDERAQIAEVFGLTGGELENTPWVPTDNAGKPFTFTYWYAGVPEYAQSDFSDSSAEYRTVCRDEMFGQVPETVTDESGTWSFVARFATSGEVECPGRQGDMVPPIPLPCPLCEGTADEGHGYVYIGDGWSEIVYRLTQSSSEEGGHTDTARAIARETGWSLDSAATARGWPGIGVGPVGQHRDSESLDKSNFEVIYSDLSDRFSDDVTIDRFGHFAFGWVEEITWNTGNAHLVAAVEAWRSALDDYPVADDMHFSELEWNDNHPSEGECYSDDDDCPCEANLTHLDTLNGTACNGDNFVPRNLTEDIAEVTCEACDTAIAPSYATPGQGDLFAVTSAS